MLALDSLLVMQDDLRHIDGIADMCDYVVAGGFWTPEYLSQYSKGKNQKVSPIIQISRFEDGSDYVHDGHHRCVGTWFGGRTYLRDDEYKLTEWSYSLYLEINPANGWYTPFDPRQHVRIADIMGFKSEARERFAINPAEAYDWILANSARYRRDKKFRTVPELAAAILRCRA